MSIKEFIVKAPILCNAIYAEKHSKVNEIIFNHEIDNNSFPKKHGEDAYDRIAFLFDWDCEDELKRQYCINLAAYAIMKHYEKEHGDKEAGKDALYLTGELLIDEIDYPDIKYVLSVEEASKGYWY
jgi:hypothetical protein